PDRRASAHADSRTARRAARRHERDAGDGRRPAPAGVDPAASNRVDASAAGRRAHPAGTGPPRKFGRESIRGAAAGALAEVRERDGPRGEPANVAGVTSRATRGSDSGPRRRTTGGRWCATVIAATADDRDAAAERPA